MHFRYALAFVGSLDWLPNEDGLTFFSKEIWPLIRARRPAARFQIVGRSPSREMLALSRIEGIEVIGTVPDTRPWLSRAALVVVPLRIGGGTRIKIFEAMAMGKAVVSTSIGAEGLPVTSGEDVVLAEGCKELIGGNVFSASVAGNSLKIVPPSQGQASQKDAVVCDHFRGESCVGA